MLEPEPAPLPSGYQEHANLTGRERFGRALPGVSRRKSTAATLPICQSHRRRWRGPAASAAQSQLPAPW